MLYHLLLHRAPDPDGLAAGINMLAQGNSVDQLEADILSSDEYFMTRGGGTNVGWLTAVYQDVLGQPLDAASQQTYTQALASGMSRLQVAQAIISSPQGLMVQVATLYNKFLHRMFDPAGMDAYLSYMQGTGNSGHPVNIEWVTAAILGSTEYFNNAIGGIAGTGGTGIGGTGTGTGAGNASGAGSSGTGGSSGLGSSGTSASFGTGPGTGLGSSGTAGSGIGTGTGTGTGGASGSGAGPGGTGGTTGTGTGGIGGTGSTGGSGVGTGTGGTSGSGISGTGTVGGGTTGSGVGTGIGGTSGFGTGMGGTGTGGISGVGSGSTGGTGTGTSGFGG
jgi:hypothetical protein